MSQKRRCQGIKDNGEQCSVTGNFVDEESGYCRAHDPDKPDEMARIGAKGGKRTAEKMRMDGINEEELPPLNSHEHAQIWLEVIGRAIGTGRLGDREGQAMIRAVSEWVKTEAEKVTSKELEDLQRQLAEVQEEISGPDWK